MKDRQNTRRVFWTGGLDSTYRLVHLLMHGSDQVQPHYIIRHESSTGNEIDTMNNIRRALMVKYPEFRSRLLPTVYTNEDLIPRFKEIDDEVEQIRETVKVHEQLQILAHYCRAFNIEQIDLTYERDLDFSPEKPRVANLFGVAPAFKSFTNPHMDLTKKDCYMQAKKEGWNDILNMTSFCRRPRKKDKPCGICGPCSDAVENGTAFRLPLIPRTKARLLLPFRQYYRRNYLKHDKGIFKFITQKFESRL